MLIVFMPRQYTGMSEFCAEYRTYITFVTQNDKHIVKVGEPDYPVAAVERCKAVLVGLNEKRVIGRPALIISE